MGMVERDPRPMRQFAREIIEYSDNMHSVCSALLSDMDSAAPFMKDETSHKAFQKIQAFAENLIKSLPQAQLASEKLNESAKFLEDAEQIQI